MTEISAGCLMTENTGLRVGDWRVMFALTEGRMEATRVMHRREAYR